MIFSKEKLSMKSYLSIAYCLFCIVITTPLPSLAQQQQSEYFLRAAKIWGKVKYFHPIASQRSDAWDSVFLSNAPRLLQTTNDRDFENIMQAMLSPLDDPLTRVMSKADGTLPQEISLQVVDTLATIRLYNIHERLDTVVSWLNRQILTLRFDSPVKHIVLDMRNNRGFLNTQNSYRPFEFPMRNILFAVLPNLLPAKLSLPAQKYRMYQSYTRAGSIAEPKEEFNLVQDAVITQKINGSAQAALPRLSILVNRAAEGIADILSALEQEHYAKIIVDDAQKHYYGTCIDLPVTTTARACVRISDMLDAKGNNYFISSSTNTLPINLPNKNLSAALLTKRDNPYPLLDRPSAEHRLLSLCRFWNVIEHFYPHKSTLEKNWDDIFREYYPVFMQANDSAQYVSAVQSLAADLHDSHTGAGKISTSQTIRLQYDYPPLLVAPIEGKLTITQILNDSLRRTTSLRPGDIITHINGKSVAEKQRERIEYGVCSFSTPQAKSAQLNTNVLLYGIRDSSYHLTVINAQNKTATIAIPLSHRQFPPPYSSEHQGIEAINDTLLCINIPKFSDAMLPEAMEKLVKAKGLIIDIRGYPRSFSAWRALAQCLAPKRTKACTFTLPYVIGDGSGESAAITGRTMDEWITPKSLPNGQTYQGKVIVLISEQAYSQAEHACLFFEAAAQPKFVGTTTNGVNGEITSLVLPGNVFVSFTYQEVRHADGRQLQRIGIQPHILAAPTIAGIRAGRDEVLEKGVEVLREMITTKK